jgi:hypothetical protein
LQNFWQKIVIFHFGFWSEEAKKKSPKEPHGNNKFYIFDGTKYNSEDLGILYSIVSK